MTECWHWILFSGAVVLTRAPANSQPKLHTYHLLCASGFPLMLHFIVYVGKRWSLAESASLKSHSAVIAELFLKCPCISGVPSLVCDVINNRRWMLCLFWCLQQLSISKQQRCVRYRLTDTMRLHKHTPTLYLLNQYFIILRDSDYY